MVQPGRTIVLPWGRGAGKTYFGRAAIHNLACSAPTSIGLLYPSLKQARAVIWEGADALFSDLEMLRRAGVVRRYHRGELYAEYANGSRLSTWGAENAHAIRGQRFGCIVSDETDEIEPELERSVVQPTFSKAGVHAIYIKLGTPRRGRHGSLYGAYAQVEEQGKGIFRTTDGKLVQDTGRPRRFYGFRVRSQDSPQVDQQWLAEVRADLYSKGKGSTYEREYECNFDASEGLVYPTFSQQHICEPNYGVPWSEVIVGVDHGWNDPGVILPIGVLGSGRDAICHVLEEVYETAKDTTWWTDAAADIAWKYRNHRQRWYCDPSRPDRISDIRRRIREKYPELEGRVTIAEGLNEIEAGVDAVADRLAMRAGPDGVSRARLYVSPRCANTIAECGKYRRKRDPKNPEAILDDIVDKDNHAMDALRYPIFTRFGGPDRTRHVLQ